LVSESVFADIDEEPNENPDDGVGASLPLDCVDEPKENDEAEGPLGEPFEGTAAPNENAVEGDVEGCLAPNENANGLAGVDVAAASVGLVGSTDALGPSSFPVSDDGAEVSTLGVSDLAG
jgi:hypothetical protein